MGTVTGSTSLSSRDIVADASTRHLQGLSQPVTPIKPSPGQARPVRQAEAAAMAVVVNPPVVRRRKASVRWRLSAEAARPAIEPTLAEGWNAAHAPDRLISSEALQVFPATSAIPPAAFPAIAAARVAQGNRPMNLSLAVLALLLASPVLILIAVSIKLTSRGPVLYRQERVGLDRRQPNLVEVDRRRTRDVGGKLFVIYKFRSMRVDAERESGAIWATKDDPRVTSVGRVLRRYRLDELPQLMNVLRGEMNIVGPRPERPTIFADLRQHLPEYALRQRAKPGITGLAQINHHYDRTLEDVRIKLRYDLEYITRQSAWQDVRIMISTVPAVFLGRGGW